jgi:hypothetical protein
LKHHRSDTWLRRFENLQVLLVRLVTPPASRRSHCSCLPDWFANLQSRLVCLQKPFACLQSLSAWEQRPSVSLQKCFAGQQKALDWLQEPKFDQLRDRPKREREALKPDFPFCHKL